MKISPVRPWHGTVDKGRPDYYLTPTHDFTQYTKDCEEKYWNRETAFDWRQDVRGNLRSNLESLAPEDLGRLAFMVLPMIKAAVERRIEHVRGEHLLPDEDALKDIAECIPFDRATIHQAISVQSPLTRLQMNVSALRDQLEILERAFLDAQEQKRLGLVREGAKVKRLESGAEREAQAQEISRLARQIREARKERKQLEAQGRAEAKQLDSSIRRELRALSPQVLVDLEETRDLIERTLLAGQLPTDPAESSRLKDLIWKRQFRALRDIANHALVVEQSAIAPITMGVIHYKRHREIQEAMTLFVNDEAKHSATFRRFLVEKLEAKEFISSKLIKGANRYMWITRFMPGTGFFIAVIVEAIGAAALEFFGNEKYMPDKLFRSICKTISEQDERRHMDLCVAIYNELYRQGDRWERFRNELALRMIMKAAYGDKTEDHPLIQAFRAFGVESDVFYRQMTSRLSHQLTRISMYVEPERFISFIGH